MKAFPELDLQWILQDEKEENEMGNKKVWKRLAALALSAVLLVPMQTVYAKEEGVEIDIENRGAQADGFEIENGVLTRYTGTASEVVIPDGVTSIGSDAFWECKNLTSVTIPESVTSIAWRAFCLCNNLTSITIPASVTSIGNPAFISCNGLTDIRVEENNPKYDSRENCNAIIETESNTLILGCKDTVIPTSVTSIGEGAFDDCIGLVNMTIPTNITSIGRYAFYGCSGLTSIVIPASVTSIGEWAFGDSKLTSIRVEESNPKYDSRENCNAIIETESNTLVSGCKNTVIPKSVTGIGEGAFEGCEITNMVLPEKVTSIENRAFYRCRQLTSITIPSSATSIAGSMIGMCDKLTSVRVEENNPKYDSRENCNAIIETESNTLLRGCNATTIPRGVTSIGGWAFDYCDGLTSVTLPEGVTSIGDYAFFGCSALKDVTISETVTNIGDYAFSNCGSFTDIVIPEGVTSIGDAVFQLCDGLKSVKIPENVTSIGYEAFFNCSSLTSIKIPEKVTSIGRFAFYNCSGFTSIKIPEKVTSIEYGAFYGCSGLADIIIPESVTDIGDEAFYGCSKELTIYGTAGSYAEAYAIKNHIKFSTGMPSQPVEKKKISDNHVMVNQDSCAYDGTAKTPGVTVKHGNAILKDGTDYIVAYENNINAGTAKVTVTGKGDYEGTVTKTFTITIENGTIHVVGAYRYQVTDAETVSLKGLNDKKTAKVKIPGTVTIGGKVFKVASVGKNAFKKNTKITSVEIGDNVKTIGASAFEGCTKLSKVTVGKGVTEIGSSVFKKCKKLSKITIKSLRLKKVGKNALKGIKPTAKIKVPAKKLKAYRKLLKNKGQGKKVKIVK